MSEGNDESMFSDGVTDSADSASEGAPEGARYLGLSPYLYYADAGEALDWLSKVFGFTEKLRYVDSAGIVFQATIAVGSAEIVLAGVGSEYWEAKGVEGPIGQLNIVYVDDVDAKHQEVQNALGPDADVSPPQDQPYGARLFTVPDIGGNSWTFWEQTSNTVELPSGWQLIKAGE